MTQIVERSLLDDAPFVEKHEPMAEIGDHAARVKRGGGCGSRIKARSVVDRSAMPVLGIAPTLAGARGERQ